MERTVVALFDDMTHAQRALEELTQSGFDKNDISLVRTNQETLQGTTTTTGEASTTTGAAAGAGIGGVLGGMAGLLVGLGALAIPGIGPIVAAGPLAAALAGAGVGAATGGILGALVDAGVPENEAGYYAEGIRRGGTLLTVRAHEEQVDRATQILNRHSPIDVDKRSAEWRTSGWTGYDPNTASYEGTYGTAGTGTYTSPMTSRFEDFDSDFRTDYRTRYGSTGYGYERYQPAYRYGWEAHQRYHDRDWKSIEPELQSDWARNHPNDLWEDFKESIRSGWEKFKGDVRHATRNFDEYDRDFRSDWEQSFKTRGLTYERYRPAYQYGFNMAANPQYGGRQWHEIEPELKRDWQMRYPDDRWDDFKDAIRNAWDRVRADVRNAFD